MWMESVRAGKSLSAAIENAWPALLAMTAGSPAARSEPRGESGPARRPAPDSGVPAKRPRQSGGAWPGGGSKPEWRLEDGAGRQICLKYNDGTCNTPHVCGRLHICAAPGCGLDYRGCPGRAPSHPECVRPLPPHRFAKGGKGGKGKGSR